MRLLYFRLAIALFAIAPWVLNGQATSPVDSLPDTPALVSVDLGYISLPQSATAAALGQATTATFNQGIVSDPALLLQGNMAGVQVYNRGGDPNTLALMRVRGLSSYSQRQPLVVVDGFVGASLEGLDPNDIAAITVLKDGTAQAMYGMRASNGVLLVRTKRNMGTLSPMAVSYSGQVANSVAYPSIPVMDAETYRAAGGLDFGAATDWMDEVQRAGLSHTHHLALEGGKDGTLYRISGNYRDVDGVLRKSGFQQTSLRANLSDTLIADRMTIDVGMAYTSRKSELGFPEAFRYATIYNPTAPILGRDAPFFINETEYGGYFEQIGSFNNYNPKSLLEQNSNNGQRQIFNATALLQYALNPKVNLNARYGHQSSFANVRTYYAPQSYYRGNEPLTQEADKGRADLADVMETRSLYEAYAQYRQATERLQVQIVVGASATIGKNEAKQLSLRGFVKEEELTLRQIGTFEKWDALSSKAQRQTSALSSNLMACFGQVFVGVKDNLSLHASARYEGTDQLGAATQWAMYPAVGAAWDLSPKITIVDLFKLRIGYGATGALPDLWGLAREQTETQVFSDGTTQTLVLRKANPDLRPERKAELNFGVDMRVGKVAATIDWYNRKVSDWAIPSLHSFPPQWSNQNALLTKGVEIAVDVQVVQTARAQYRTGLLLASQRSFYGALEQEPTIFSYPGGAIASLLVAGKEGEQVGQLMGVRFTGMLDAAGNVIFEDVNGDGFINLNLGADLYTSNSDYQVLGKGLPSLEVGWTHHWQVGPWALQALVRGAFGHSLYNRYRIFHEIRYPRGYIYNYVVTDLYDSAVLGPIVVDRAVERADFVKLDNLSVSRTFAIGKAAVPNSLRLSAGVQNLLLFSHYTGADPEPALEDPGTGGAYEQAERYGFAPTPLVLGIDRRTSYLPSKTFFVAVAVGL